MKKILPYLNPINHLGDTSYSFFFPFSTTIGIVVLLEFIAYFVLSEPEKIGLYAILVLMAAIIYFSFRDGIKGGIVTTGITVAYYIYIIYTHDYTGEQFINAISTTLFLGSIYILLSLTIGWLKQTIDKLIERESNEKRRLQIILQQLPVGVIITNDSGEVIEANRGAETILNTKIPQGSVIGRVNLAQAQQNGKKIKAADTPIAIVLRTGKPIVDREYIINGNRKERYILANASPIHNKSGKLIAAASILVDVTPQKEIEQRKEDFINMASHELKTPLTSLKLYIDSLTRKLKLIPDERTVHIIKHIGTETKRLQKIVNELLDVSRIQTGKLSFKKEEFRLEQLIQESIDVVLAVHKREIVFESRPPIKIFADKFRIYQVLTNLINNAVKYSPQRKPIFLKLKRSNGEAQISVTDYGIGIPKDQHTKIFDRLYQVSKTSTNTFPGFGMGLYISKEIIKRHKGRIWVESEEGKGSTFYFTLPIIKD